MLAIFNLIYRKEFAMNDVITSILTDTDARDTTTVEAALQQQAVATPWVNIEA